MDTNAMSFEITHKTFTVCRCCSSLLSSNIYKDSTYERWSTNNIETYEAMLKETFDIQLTQYEHTSKLICDDCVKSLQDAHCFKRMVINSEESLLSQFQMMVEQKESDYPEMEYKMEVKVETFPLVGSLEDSHGEGSSGDEEILANIVSGVKKRYRTRSQKKKRNKQENITPVRKNSSKSEKDWLKISERRGNGPILRENSLKLISNSTLCIFQWNKSRYRCFCCKEPYSDMNLLRTHMNEHNLDEIERKIIAQQNRLVKVEVSLIRCKICDREIENLDALKSHLESHGIQFASKEDLLVPFRIESDLKCQICSEKFSVFRLLNIHMNRHFQKQVCHVCGAGFSNLVFLNLHKSRSHKPFLCKTCDLIFPSKIEKKEHDVNTHGVKVVRKFRFPCPYCPERFFQENLRVLHLVEKHAMEKPAHKCMLCAKEFVTKSLCNNHVKNVHMKEKRHACDVCNSMFYTKSDVARHKVTHSGEKKYSCDLCSNLFATKDSLRRHTKRTHGVV